MRTSQPNCVVPHWDIVQPPDVYITSAPQFLSQGSIRQVGFFVHRSCVVGSTTLNIIRQPSLLVGIFIAPRVAGYTLFGILILVLSPDCSLLYALLSTKSCHESSGIAGFHDTYHIPSKGRFPSKNVILEMLGVILTYRQAQTGSVPDLSVLWGLGKRARCRTIGPPRSKEATVVRGPFPWACQASMVGVSLLIGPSKGYSNFVSGSALGYLDEAPMFTDTCVENGA